MTEHGIGSGDQLIDNLQSWAAEHVAHSNGKLGLLAYAPELYPGQSGFNVMGDPQSAAVVDGIARLAHPSYPEILHLLNEQEDRTYDVSRIGEILHGGSNVILATNHSDLIDIAITHAAFYSLLNRMGYEFNTGIIISKMVAFLAYKLGEEMAPTVGVLKLLEDEQFLSYPRTEGARKQGLGRIVLADETTRHNRHMRSRVVRRLSEGRVLLAAAPSGTTDKPSHDDPNMIQMGKVGTGTSIILQSEGTLVVPVAVDYNSKKPIFEICDIPRKINDTNATNIVMGRIAERLTKKHSSKTYIYRE